jgi:hypothetical protein
MRKESSSSTKEKKGAEGVGRRETDGEDAFNEGDVPRLSLRVRRRSRRRCRSGNLIEWQISQDCKKNLYR